MFLRNRMFRGFGGSVIQNPISFPLDESGEKKSTLTSRKGAKAEINPFHSKKSQMEFVGLAIAIVLIILGILFFMTFSKPAQDTTRRDIANMQLSNNFLSTLLESQAGCGQHTFKDLLQDAALPNPVIKCENDIDSKNKINFMVNSVLGNTLRIWKKGHELKITIPGKVLPDYKSTAGCSAKRVISPARYPLPDGIVLELKICD